MKISEWLSELKSRNPLLYSGGLANLIVLVPCFILFFSDDRTVTGINAWIKPIKFLISVAIYLWTFGWLLHYVKNQRNKMFISWGILICMVVENVLVIMQAARGVPSHFNIHSAFDGMVFGIMGMFIGINTFLIFYTLVLFFTKAVSAPPNMLIAWRVGLLLFLVGGISGGLMVTHLSHTYGASDGGPGLPLLNWSTVAGDIRSAHFITLHGLQVIPLFAWFISKKTSHSTWATLSFFIFYSLICIALHMIALSGRPLISI